MKARSFRPEGGMTEAGGAMTRRDGMTGRGGIARTGGPAAVEVRGLTKSFGRVTAVRDMSFTAPAGKVTGFLGPNGSGKTTTLRMVLGLVRPDAGPRVLPGHAAAPRAGLGAARRPAGAPPRRTGQRPRPGRHRLASRPAARSGRRGPDRRGRQPRAQRGR